MYANPGQNGERHRIGAVDNSIDQGLDSDQWLQLGLEEKCFKLKSTPPANAFIEKEKISEEQEHFPLEILK